MNLGPPSLFKLVRLGRKCSLTSLAESAEASKPSAEGGRGAVSKREEGSLLGESACHSETCLVRVGQVEEESAYFVTKDGQIVDFSGSSLKVKEALPSR